MLYVKPFSSIPERNGQTDRRTDRFAISISRVSVLKRDKNISPLFGDPQKYHYPVPKAEKPTYSTELYHSNSHADGRGISVPEQKYIGLYFLTVDSRGATVSCYTYFLKSFRRAVFKL